MPYVRRDEGEPLQGQVDLDEIGSRPPDLPDRLEPDSLVAADCAIIGRRDVEAHGVDPRAEGRLKHRAQRLASDPPIASLGMYADPHIADPPCFPIDSHQRDVGDTTLIRMVYDQRETRSIDLATRKQTIELTGAHPTEAERERAVREGVLGPSRKSTEVGTRLARPLRLSHL